MTGATLVICAAVTGCGKKPSGGDKVLARVSNKVITLNDLNSKIARIPAYYKNIVEKNKKRYLDEVIVETLFYEEAIRQGVDRDKEVKEVISEAKKKILIAKLIKNEIEDRSKVTDGEMARFYEENKENFKTPPLWRASHILVGTEKEARDVLDELVGGALFSDLARARSTDATASRGGDIGFFRQGQLVAEFEKACLKLEVGQTSDVVHTQFGYHVIRLTDKKDPQVELYEEAKRVIESELKRKKRSELFDELVLRLKRKYGVEIKEGVLKMLEGADAEEKS